MNKYRPPYTITSKMPSLSTAIGEVLTKLEYEESRIVTMELRQKNRIETIDKKLAEFAAFIKFMFEVILETVDKVGNKVGNRVGNRLTENLVMEVLRRVCGTRGHWETVDEAGEIR